MNQNFLCPITQAVMTDPVIGSDGITYERSAIEAWFAMGKTTSPMTRQPMASTSLVPNYALKAMIEETPVTPAPVAVATKFEAPTPTITVTKSDTAYHVSVSTSDGEQNTKPTLFIDVLDISGSMGNPAAESAGAGEAALFSRADLVRHSVATQIELLRPQDELAVILFDNNATVALPPTQMTGTGRMVAKAILPQISPRGGTNIWNGLHKALTLATTADTVNKNVVIILQTDGESDPSYNPPRGIPAAAQAWLDTNNKTHVTVHTVGYGFGKALDMPLLQQLATIGRGTVNYIPDGSMVGTVFIHLMANLMSTAYTGLQLQVPEAGICEPIHFLQAGQSRDFIIKSDLDTFTVAVTGPATAETKVTAATVPIDDMSVAVHDARASACTLIETLLAGGEAGEGLTILKYRATPGWLRMQDTHRSGDPSFYENPSIVALRTDFDHPDPNKGQISKAVATADAFNKWGRHYLPCYLSGLRNQWAINFKDEASKLFGSDYTKSLIERGERLFNDLPAPQASYAPRGAAPISMYAVNNAGGGCFLHGSLVKMANGKYRPCEELKAGDLVYNGYKIRCVVKTTLPSVEFVALGTVEKGKDMIVYGGFTAWHPVKIGEHWRFPADIARPQVIHDPTTVYNFVLEKGHTLIVNGITACTLAHDFTGPVIGHSYFGKREPGVRHVLDDLEAHPDWPTGLVNWAPQIHRDSKTGLITGMSATK